MKVTTASVATIDRLMGHDVGPTPDRLRGQVDRPAVLVGFLPAVHANEAGSAWGTRVAEVFGRICMLVTFVLFVIVPVIGVLGLVIGH